MYCKPVSTGYSYTDFFFTSDNAMHQSAESAGTFLFFTNLKKMAWDMFVGVPLPQKNRAEGSGCRDSLSARASRRDKPRPTSLRKSSNKRSILHACISAINPFHTNFFSAFHELCTNLRNLRDPDPFPK